MSTFWLAVCTFLVIAATDLYQAEPRGGEPCRLGVFATCGLALFYALSWPARAVRVIASYLGGR